VPLPRFIIFLPGAPLPLLLFLLVGPDGKSKELLRIEGV